MGLIIRPVRYEDAGALRKACWPGRSLRAIQLRVQRVVDQTAHGLGWGRVAEVDGEVVGYGQLTHWKGRGAAEISNLAVAVAWRGHGIGTEIIQTLLAIARANQIQRVEIGAAKSNPRALALYRRLGFVVDRQVVLDLGDGPEPVIYLYLTL